MERGSSGDPTGATEALGRTLAASERGARTAGDTATRVLSVAVAAYVLALFLVSSLPGLSRLVHVSLGVVVVALLARAASGRLRLAAEPLILAMWTFFAYAFASVLWSPVQDPALVRAVGVFFDILGATAIWLAMANGVGLRRLGLYFAAGAAVQAAIGLTQYAASPDMRAGGLTGNANALALQLAMAAFVVIAGVVGRRSWRHLFAFFLILVATIVSGSQKMAIVWLAYLALAYRAALPRLRSRVVSGLLLLALPVVLTLLWNFGDVALQPVRSLIIVERLEDTLQGEDTSSLKRLDMIQEALQVWSTSPVIGHGIDQFRHLARFGTYSHNNYTEVLADFGLIGLLLFYSIPVTLLAWVLPRAARGDERAWLVVVVTGMLLVLDAANVSYSNNMYWLMLAILIGIASQPGASSYRADAPVP